MHTHTIALAALAIGVLAALPAKAAPESSSKARTQCKRGEQVYYSCDFAKGTASVCLKGNTVTYRFGPLGKPGIEISSNGKDRKAYGDDTVGAQAASQGAIRFVKGDRSYIVFSSRTGGLSDTPDKLSSGLATYKGHKDEKITMCKRSGPLQDMSISPGFLPGDPDEFFRAWY